MQLIDNTSEVLIEVDKRSQHLLHSVAKEMEIFSKSIVHVRTGRLQRSIQAIVTKNKLVLGSPVFYAGFVEARFPYLRPALAIGVSSLRRRLGGMA